MVSATRMDRAPTARSRLYLLLAWFHAVVQERLRYCPVGWTKAYEFSDADFLVGLDCIDAWLVRVPGCFHFPTAAQVLLVPLDVSVDFSRWLDGANRFIVLLVSVRARPSCLCSSPSVFVSFDLTLCIDAWRAW